MDDRILKIALQNAVLHEGNANPKAVLGTVLGEIPELRKNIPAATKIVDWVTAQVNDMPPEEQQASLEKLGGLHEKPQQEGLPPLEGAEQGKVVTRFAPAPTGPLNILQTLRAVLISSLYAREYEGTFILRFEDTDPKVIAKEYYDMIRDDLTALGVKWDKEYVQSDYMNLYYKEAEELLQNNKAYVCFCDAQEFQVLKKKQEDCPCRWNRPDKNILGWKGMLDGRYPEGGAVVRLMTSMQDPNPAMRDPPLLRIAEGDHPLTGTKYRVWPLYNFANMVMDSFCHVTHAFRGKEHEHNTAIQKLLYKAFDRTPPRVVNFGMMYLPGEKLHTRDIKQGIADGSYSGWDDLRLPTVRSFIRRGFQPQAFEEFAMVCGLSKTDIRIDVQNFEAINRQLIDSQATRYMAVLDPVAIDISAILEQTGLVGSIKVKNHPDREDTREVPVTGTLYISGDDFKRFHGRDVRLLDLFNVTLDEHPTFSKIQEFTMRTPKIQWVADKNTPLTILYPDHTATGLSEQAFKDQKPGSLVQLLRIGFCRVEKSGTAVFAHK